MTAWFHAGGLRARVGEAPMTAQIVKQLGFALGRWAGTRVFVGRDPRATSNTVWSWLQEGLSASCQECVDVGVLPTPALAWIARTQGSCAVMITGSHNTREVSGLKVFDAQGYALTEKDAQKIEDTPYEPTSFKGTIVHENGYQEAYARSFMQACDVPCVIDCANGACAEIVKFLPFATRVYGLDGEVNAGVGVMHPNFLQRRVVEAGVPAGFAFDADGDRVFACDHTGHIFDGQDLVALLACHIPVERVAVSAVTNTGMIEALEHRGVVVDVCGVGDAVVAQAMREARLKLGGEPSGHVLLDTTVGDGLRVMMHVLALMEQRACSLATLRIPWKAYPSWGGAFSYEVGSLSDDDIINFEKTIPKDRVKVHVRLSATTPVVRARVEGRTHEDVEEARDFITDGLHTLCRTPL